MYRLKKTGTAAVLVTPGALTRVNEEILREKIVVNDWLKQLLHCRKIYIPNIMQEQNY